jgi:hypothetical protein
VDVALVKGHRGLPGGWSLAKLLHERRGARHLDLLPRFTVKQILALADDHKERTGVWPTCRSGAIRGAPGETWMAVAKKLEDGGRGLRGGTTLTRLLEQHRGVRNPANLPRLTHKKILAWMRAFHDRTGTWPRHTSGPIPEAPGETWATVHWALVHGRRGLRGGLRCTTFEEGPGNLPPDVRWQSRGLRLAKDVPR